MIMGMGFLFRKSEKIISSKDLNNIKSHWFHGPMINFLWQLWFEGGRKFKTIGKITGVRKEDRLRSYNQVTFRLNFLWRNQVAVQNNRVQKRKVFQNFLYIISYNRKSMIYLSSLSDLIFKEFISAFNNYNCFCFFAKFYVDISLPNQSSKE